jgi:DNA invertase Pin-like site-specific DNA recombinase
MRFFGYGRHSTDKQHVTEQVQRERVEQIYEQTYKPAGYEWAGWFYDEAVSGSSSFTDRPEGFRLWGSVVHGDVVGVLHSDRAFRDTEDALRTTAAFRQRGVHLHLPDVAYDAGTADGKLISTIQFAVSMHQRQRGCERTRDSMRKLSKQGVWFGGKNQSAPYGWQGNGNGFTVDPQERARLDEMAAMRASGLSYDRISAIVSRPPYNWRRKRGQQWCRRAVRLGLEARDKAYPQVHMYSRYRRRDAAAPVPGAVVASQSASRGRTAGPVS